MEENAYIGGVIAGFAFFIVGIRLTRLSLRTGENPERLLGATFLLWGLSYFAWELPIALADESIVRPFFVIERVLNNIGVVTSALFLRLVFRSQERWAWWLVVITTLSLLIGQGGSVTVGDWEGVLLLSNPWLWLETIGGMAPVVWMCGEGFIQYRMARQRLRLGLCDPLVGGLEIGAITMIWRVFFPPAIYPRWISRDVVAGTAEGR